LYLPYGPDWAMRRVNFSRGRGLISWGSFFERTKQLQP
jgi:hypothetical protein